MFGIWNDVEKRFVFGIRKSTVKEAEKAFFNKAGKTAFKYRFSVREIPDNWVNPKNTRYQRKDKSIMSIFDKFSNQINADDLKASQKEIQDNSNGGGNYEEVPVGKYEVKVDKLECKMSKSGNPMVSIWFKILKGKYEKSLIFYNGVFREDWMRHRVAKILSDILDDGDRTAEINLILKSNNVQVVNDLCLDIHEAVDGRLEYLLDYGQSKGYNTYTIKEVFDAE